MESWRMGCAGSRRGLAGAALATAVLLAAAAGAQAAGVFSRESLGEWLEGYDIRGEALGATGIGVVDPFNFTLANPAASAFATDALGTLGLEGTVNWTADESHESRRGTGAITGFGFHVPLSRWSVRGAVQPRTDAVYTLQELVPTGSGDAGNLRTFEGGRGLIGYSADLAFRPRPGLAMAVRAGIVAGSLLDETSYVFADSGLADNQDQRTMRIEPTWTYGAGLLWAPVARVSVGACASAGARMSTEETYRTAGGLETTTTSSIDYPLGLGAGLGWLVLPRLRLSADLFWRNWEEVEVGGAPLPQPGIGPYRSTLRWGVGLERTARRGPAEGFWNRVSWRAGFAWIPWYAEDQRGEAPVERRLSAGLGLPIRNDRGTVDLLLAYGLRGAQADTGIEESYLRVGFGATFGRMLREY